MSLGNSDKTNNLDQQEIALMYGSLQAIIDSLGRLLTLAHLKGNTDGTLIGNVGDRLKIDAETAAFSSPSQLNYLDMNASNGGVARDTSIGNTFTNIFSYTGSGALWGFRVNFESTGADFWNLRLVVNGSIYPFFGSTGIDTNDLTGTNGYDIGDTAVAGRPFVGLARHDNTVTLELDRPMTFGTSIAIQAKNYAASRKIKAGYVKLEKYT